MFTWTDEKNQLNKKKPGFYLSDIVGVFDDPHLLEFYDAAHSSFDEDRYISLGRFHDEAYNEHYRKSTDSDRN